MMKVKSIKKSLFLIFFIIFFLASCGSSAQERPETEPVSRSKLLLGTASRVTLYDGVSDEAFEAAFAKISRIEEEMSVNIPESEISQVNRAAGSGSPVTVSRDTFAVIEEALEIARRSDGYFDPTIGPLVALWGIGTDEPRIPGPEEIEEALELVDYRLVEIDREEQSVYLSREGMRLDLGGIAKGYAADEVRTVLRDKGVSSAIINLGGNVLTVGRKPDGSVWRIGVQDPASERGEYVMILDLDSMAIVTSGPYERYFTGPEGRRYHHILDTRDGYPSDSDMTSATIVTEDSFIADALSTAAYAMGRKRGIELVESYHGVEAIFMTADNTIYVTSGLQDGSIGYRMTDEDYTVAR